jgi:hypothetical protein
MHYNDYNIFRWNKNNCLFTNFNNIYNDVYLHTGTIIKGQWENSICATKKNNKIQVVWNSNHFLHGCEWSEAYNLQYQIFDNLAKNYLEIVNSDKNINYTLYNSNTYFSMLDAFSFSNSGHNLSYMLDAADYILNNNIKNILIFKNYKNTHNFKFIHLLLPTDCNFIELDENTIYNINNLIVIHPEFHNIWKHKHLMEKLKIAIEDKYSTIYNNCKFKNIILMKTNRNKNVMLEHSRIHCEKLLCMLEENDFINIIPEDIDVFQLAMYIMFAKNILFSTGAVIYTNKIFINPTSTVFSIHNALYDGHGLNDVICLSATSNVISDEESIKIYNEIIKNKKV